jgi:hypothetical protein
MLIGYDPRPEADPVGPLAQGASAIRPFNKWLTRPMILEGVFKVNWSACTFFNHDRISACAR